MDLCKKVVLVTGASSGIGVAVAVHFAREKCRLVLTGRQAEALEKTKKECLEAGATAATVAVGDVTDENNNQLDVLINNAGVLVNGEMSTSPLADFDKVMLVNVRSVIALTKACTPALVASKGVVVNLSSIAAHAAFPGVGYYCVSKGALDHYTHVLALELAPKGVRVNAVNPGVIVTDIHKRAGMTETEYAAFVKRCAETHALGRTGTVDEVARAVMFLARDATFTTGETLRVDGGRGLMVPR